MPHYRYHPRQMQAPSYLLLLRYHVPDRTAVLDHSSLKREAFKGVVSSSRLQRQRDRNGKPSLISRHHRSATRFDADTAMPCVSQGLLAPRGRRLSRIDGRLSLLVVVMALVGGQCEWASYLSDVVVGQCHAVSIAGAWLDRVKGALPLRGALAAWSDRRATRDAVMSDPVVPCHACCCDA